MKAGFPIWVIPVLVGAIAFGIGLVVFAPSEEGDRAGESAGAGDDADGSSEGSTDGLGFTPYRPPSAAYETVLPDGPGWSRGAESLVNGAIYRTTARGPSGIELIIDYSPGERATFSIEDQANCRSFENPAFELAKRCTFQGGVLPQCQAAPCVNHLLNLSETGPGYAVLAGGGDLDTAESVAGRVARSLRPR